MRHKISLELIHYHIFYIMLKCFKAQIIAAKPLTEFAMRKTFWVLWQGFDPKTYKKYNFNHFLYQLIHYPTDNMPPYAIDPQTKACYHPIMLGLLFHILFLKHTIFFGVSVCRGLKMCKLCNVCLGCSCYITFE